MSEILRAEGVTRIFNSGATEVHALADVTIGVSQGELTVVHGPSGSGKTTLLNLLGGLDRPTAGRVLFDGDTVLSELPEHALLKLRRTRIGYVFQSFGLVPVLSARENVEVPLRLLHTPQAERRSRVDEVLEQVGLAGHASQRPYELSGGQQQRVGIARALVADPDVLIADEPTGQLDSDTAATIMQLLADLSAQRGLATVISTHNPMHIAMAQHRVELLDGKVRSTTG